MKLTQTERKKKERKKKKKARKSGMKGMEQKREQKEASPCRQDGRQKVQKTERRKERWTRTKTRHGGAWSSSTSAFLATVAINARVRVESMVELEFSGSSWGFLQILRFPPLLHWLTVSVNILKLQ